MVLVTGATGLLGSYFLMDLLLKGYQVKAIRRTESSTLSVIHFFRLYFDQKTAEKMYGAILWHQADLEDIPSLENAMEGVETVYHLAGKVSFAAISDKELIKVNRRGTANVVNACLFTGVQNLCFVSSVAALSNKNASKLLDETYGNEAHKDMTFYGLTKLAGEMEVWRAQEEGLNVTIVNPSVVLGSGHWENSSGKMFAKLLSSPFYFKGSAGFVDARDVADISEKLIKNKVFGQRFILNSGVSTYKQFSEYVRKKAGKPRAKGIPFSVVKVFNRILKIQLLLLAKKTNFSKTLLEAISSEGNYSNEKLGKYMSHDYIPVSDSLEHHTKHFFEYKHIKYEV